MEKSWKMWETMANRRLMVHRYGCYSSRIVGKEWIVETAQWTHCLAGLSMNEGQSRHNEAVKVMSSVARHPTHRQPQSRHFAAYPVVSKKFFTESEFPFNLLERCRDLLDYVRMLEILSYLCKLEDISNPRNVPCRNLQPLGGELRRRNSRPGHRILCKPKNCRRMERGHNGEDASSIENARRSPTD